MRINKILKTKTIVASLVVAIVFLIVAPALIIANNFLQPYSRALVALDKAEISKNELSTCIDVILEEEIDVLNLENIDDKSIETLFHISGKIAHIIEPKVIAKFVHYYIFPPESNKSRIFLARKYYTSKFKDLSNKLSSNSENSTKDFIQNIYEILLTEESRKTISENVFRQDLPFITEFYFVLTKFLYEERINDIYFEVVNDGIEQVAVRDLCYFGIELGKSMSSLSQETLKTGIKYILENTKYNENLLNIDKNIIKILDYPLAILAIFNYLSEETEVSIVNKCLDYPHLDLVFNNFLQAIKETDYYLENEAETSEELDEAFEILYNIYFEYFEGD